MVAYVGTVVEPGPFLLGAMAASLDDDETQRRLDAYVLGGDDLEAAEILHPFMAPSVSRQDQFQLCAVQETDVVCQVAQQGFVL